MKIVIHPEYSFLADFINSLPETFALEGEVIYNERNILKRYQVQGVDLIVKSFKVPILVNKVAYTFFRKSKACRSYEYAVEILRRGGNTPEPIAYIEEYKYGLLCRSFYVSEFKAGAITVRGYMDGEITNADDVLRSFVRFTIGIQRVGIFHVDYSPGNVLMNTNSDGTCAFSLIDINRLSFKQISIEEALNNFDRMALSLQVSTRLAELYAEECSLDKEQTVRKINDYSDRFFLKRTIKQSMKAQKKSHGVWAAFFGPLQYYFFLRRLRLMLSGNEEGFLYRKERALYNSCIRPHDERRVLERRYRY